MKEAKRIEKHGSHNVKNENHKPVVARNDSLQSPQQAMTPHSYTINSFEEMDNFLNELQANASESVAEALKAQLTVIRYVKSPTLVDTTLDTLILNLKKSLKYAESPKMEDELREKFSLMIQNYIFFFDARLQYEIDTNKKRAGELYDAAGKMLSESVTEVAMLAMGSGNAAGGKAVTAIVVKNLFAQNDSDESAGFLQKLVKWWRHEKIVAEKQHEFYNTILKMFQKLDKYQELIGPSMLINGVIERYAENIADYAYSDIANIKTFQQGLLYQIEDMNLFTSNSGWTITAIIIGASTLVLRQIWYWISGAGGKIISWFSDSHTITDHSGWFLPHFYWVLAIVVAIELIVIIRNWSKRSDLYSNVALMDEQIAEEESKKEKFKNEILEMADKFSEI